MLCDAMLYIFPFIECLLFTSKGRYYCPHLIYMETGAQITWLVRAGTGLNPGLFGSWVACCLSHQCDCQKAWRHHPSLRSGCCGWLELGSRCGKEGGGRGRVSESRTSLPVLIPSSPFIPSGEQSPFSAPSACRPTQACAMCPSCVHSTQLSGTG